MIQEYLSMLKESDELDLIVPDLLSSMNFNIVAGAQKGVRQEGVDIHAIGIDKDSNLKTNYLITVKKGDITRDVWSSNKQAVRQSLEDIIDVYVTQKMTEEQLKLPTKIILCFGGELKQEVQSNWVGFQSKYKDYNFVEWSGNQLSALIEEYLTNEHLFFGSTKQDFRRSIVFLSDIDYKLTHYDRMLNELLDKDTWSKKAKSSFKKDAVKTLRTISLSLGMLNQYAKESNNQHHTINAAELASLKSWSFIIDLKLEKNKHVLNSFNQIYMQYMDYSAKYYQRIEPYCFHKDGICQQTRDSITSSIVTFKQIGILSSFGLTQFMYGLSTKEERGFENSKFVSNALTNVIKNNSISGSPVFDGQTIDICLAIYFLSLSGKIEEIKEWIQKIIHRFHYSYKVLEKQFPNSYDSIEKIIEFEYGGQHTKEKMACMSTLIPTLAYWCAILDFQEEYNEILELVKELKETDLQLWFPEKGIKKYLYKENAANKAGIAEAPIFLPDSLDELKLRIKEFIKYSTESQDFETTWNDCPPALPLIASRHYRTPVIPFFWLTLIEANIDYSARQKDSI
jgi:hypothetical protein